MITVEEIHDMLDNSDGTDLDLSYRNLGVTGARVVSIFLASDAASSLVYLNLTRNDLGVRGAKALAAALAGNATLRELHLDYNDIGNAGARALAEALESNLTLAHLNMYGNNIDVDEMENCQRFIRRNKEYAEGQDFGEKLEEVEVPSSPSPTSHPSPPSSPSPAPAPTLGDRVTAAVDTLRVLRARLTRLLDLSDRALSAPAPRLPCIIIPTRQCEILGLNVRLGFVCPATLSLRAGNHGYAAVLSREHAAALWLAAAFFRTAIDISRLAGRPVPHRAALERQVEMVARIRAAGEEEDGWNVVRGDLDDLEARLEQPEGDPEEGRGERALRASYATLAKLARKNDDAQGKLTGLARADCARDRTAEYVHPAARSIYVLEGRECVAAVNLAHVETARPRVRVQGYLQKQKWVGSKNKYYTLTDRGTLYIYESLEARRSDQAMRKGKIKHVRTIAHNAESGITVCFEDETIQSFIVPEGMSSDWLYPK